MDFSKQIAEDQRLLLADIRRRIEAALQPFANDLDDFLAVLFQGRLPVDWRQQWHAFVAEAATKGFFVNPKSVVELEEWIEAWARFCGLLPRSDDSIGRNQSGRRQLVGSYDASLARPGCDARGSGAEQQDALVGPPADGKPPQKGAKPRPSTASKRDTPSKSPKVDK